MGVLVRVQSGALPSSRYQMRARFGGLLSFGILVFAVHTHATKMI